MQYNSWVHFLSLPPAIQGLSSQLLWHPVKFVQLALAHLSKSQHVKSQLFKFYLLNSENPGTCAPHHSSPALTCLPTLSATHYPLLPVMLSLLKWTQVYVIWATEPFSQDTIMGMAMVLSWSLKELRQTHLFNHLLKHNPCLKTS